MFAMTSRPYGWGLRNIAKIDRGTANYELLLFFFKNCRNDSNENFDSNFTHYGGPMCAMTLIS